MYYALLLQWLIENVQSGLFQELEWCAVNVADELCEVLGLKKGQPLPSVQQMKWCEEHVVDELCGLVVLDLKK